MWKTKEAKCVVDLSQSINNIKMTLEGFIWKLTLFCIFWEVNEQFIQTLFPFYHVRTIKQSYNNLYFHNH